MCRWWIKTILVALGGLFVFTGWCGEAAGIGRKARTEGFSCDGRVTGYYADIESGCRVYHMCDGLGRQFTYSCPNATLFQQRMLVCDHWYMVNCSRASGDYDAANRLIGRADQPFVSEEERESARRTPRPDILTATGNFTEYNVIYRTGKDQYYTPKYVVGVETEEDATDKPTYYPPSHWSTAYARSATTTNRPIRREDSQEYNERNFSPPKKVTVKNKSAKTIDFNSARSGNSFGDTPVKQKTFQTNLPPPSFKSNFKGTSPVYPSTVTAPSREDIGLPPSQELAPPEHTADRKIDQDTSEQRPPVPTATRNVNFQSNFHATTPVYPSKEELDELLSKQTHGVAEEGRAVPVNFESNFRATTPVYPASVDQTSPDPGEVGLLAPKGNLSQKENHNNGELQTVSVNESNFKATTPVYPTSVDHTSPDPAEVGLRAPKGDSNQDEKTSLKADTETTTTNQVHVNFESNYKATTPVYPQTVEPTSPNPEDTGLVPPKRNERTNQTHTKHSFVVYPSNFKATTPVYPKTVDATSPSPSNVGLEAPSDGEREEAVSKEEEVSVVNFVSNFKATTPVYPTSVEATSPNPNGIGLLPPKQTETQSVVDGTKESLLLDLVPPAFDKNYKPEEHIVTTTQAPPSKFYQPPKIEPDFTDEHTDDAPDQKLDNTGIRILNFMKSFNNSQWQDLRKAFLIPEYDFPLEDASRPSYDSVLNSFEAKKEQKVEK